MKPRYILFIFILFILIWVGSAYLFKPGKDVYSESYHIENISSTEDLINKINLFKNSNPQYKAYQHDGEDSIELVSTYNSQIDAYYVYFNLRDDSLNLLCRVHGDIIELLRFKRYNIISGWSNINSRRIEKKENKLIKKKFQQEILSRLNENK
ncbi:hypothetical protein [Dysgonomonas capnocytophagoides]|uniref:hypothetical protein n=1 Tax=Dysgonomonas capnocytophagoides TaxID=45254 RepID=UPI00047A63E2|nr:hypothetical protein [Dysgonomonas capnocytophagoides]